MIDPFKLDDPRLQKGLELLASQMEKKAKTKAKKEPGALPYYTEEYALKVKSWLDELHEKKVPICVEGAVNTVRNKYYQGVKYLYEKIDRKYEDIFRRTRAVTNATQLELYIRQAPLRQIHNTHEVFTQEGFVEFITTANVGDKYYLKTLLTEEQVEWIISKLLPLGGMFISSVTTEEIKVIRVN